MMGYMNEYDVLCDLPDASWFFEDTDSDDGYDVEATTLDRQFNAIVGIWHEIQKLQPVAGILENIRIEDVYNLAHATSSCFTPGANNTPTTIRMRDPLVASLYVNLFVNVDNTASGLFDRLTYDHLARFCGHS